MSHLTAVSGGNVAVVTASALVVSAWARRGLRWRAAGSAAALLGFVVLARPSASVLRAAVMGLIGLAALAAGRPRAVLPALAASVTVLVLAQPALAVSAGFALSVLATGGMIVFAAGCGMQPSRGGCPTGSPRCSRWRRPRSSPARRCWRGSAAA